MRQAVAFLVEHMNGAGEWVCDSRLDLFGMTMEDRGRALGRMAHLRSHGHDVRLIDLGRIEADQPPTSAPLESSSPTGEREEVIAELRGRCAWQHYEIGQPKAPCGLCLMCQAASLLRGDEATTRIEGWMAAEAFDFLSWAKDEARTRDVPVSTFPLKDSDEPVLVIRGPIHPPSSSKTNPEDIET